VKNKNNKNTREELVGPGKRKTTGSTSHLPSFVHFLAKQKNITKCLASDLCIYKFFFFIGFGFFSKKLAGKRTEKVGFGFFSKEREK
jgi:hypothetical protein